MNWTCPRCDEDNFEGGDYIVGPGAELKCPCGQRWRIEFEQLNDPDEEVSHDD